MICEKDRWINRTASTASRLTPAHWDLRAGLFPPCEDDAGLGLRRHLAANWDFHVKSKPMIRNATGMHVDEIRPHCVPRTVAWWQPGAGSLNARQHREETLGVELAVTLLLARQPGVIPLQCRCDARRATQRARIFVHCTYNRIYHALLARHQVSSAQLPPR